MSTVKQTRQLLTSFAFNDPAAGAFRDNEARMLAPGLCASDGSASSHTDIPTAQQDHALLADAYMVPWRDQLWVGGAIGAENVFNGLGVRAGAQVTLAAEAWTRAQQPTRARAPRVPQEVVKQHLRGFALYSGVALAQGIGLVHGEQLAESRRQYTLQLRRETACWLRQRNQGVFWPWLRDTVQSLARTSPVLLPDPRHPSALRSGDSMVAQSTRHRAVFMALGFIWLFFGRLMARSRHLRWHATQDGTQQTVTISLGSVTTRRWVGLVPGMVVGDRGYASPTATAWRYRFDMNKVADRAACAALRAQLLREPATQSAVDALQQRLSHAARRLPERMECLQDARQTSHELGVLFGIYPIHCWRQVLPRGFGLGLMAQRFVNVRTHHVHDGARTQQATVYRRGSTGLWGPRGQHHDTVMATVSQQDGAAPSLVLSLHLKRSRATSAMYAAQLLAPINDLFGTRFATPTPSPVCASREVYVYLPVSGDALQRLREVCMTKAPWGEWVGSTDLRAARQADDTAWAHAVAQFVQQHGVAGLRAIYQGIGATPDALDIETTSDAYDKLLTAAHDLELLYPDPPHPCHGRRGLLQRFARVERALLQVEATRQQACDDPLLGAAARHRVLERCRHTEARLRALVRVTGGAECREIKRCLRRGLWRTRLDERVLAALRHDVGKAATDLLMTMQMSNNPIHQRACRRATNTLQSLRRRLQNDLFLPPRERAARCQRIDAVLQQLQRGEAITGVDAPAVTAAWTRVQHRAHKAPRRWLRVVPAWFASASPSRLEYYQERHMRHGHDLLIAVMSAHGRLSAHWKRRNVQHARRYEPEISNPLRTALGEAILRRREQKRLTRAALARDNYDRLGLPTETTRLADWVMRARLVRVFAHDPVQRLRQDLRALPLSQRQALAAALRRNRLWRSSTHRLLGAALQQAV